MSSSLALAELPQAPRFTYPCCGSTVGPIDACLALAETVAITGTVASIILKMTWPAIVFGTATVIVLGSHALYRRYGNLAGYVRVFQQAQESFGQSSRSQQETIERLRLDIDGIELENGRLLEENRTLGSRSEELSGTVQQLRGVVLDLQRENEGLQRVNEDLGEKMKALNALAKEMKQGVGEFTGQNQQLREVVVDAAGVTTDLGRVAPDLGGAVKAFDTTFDEDLADFGGVIEKIRALFLQLQQQNADYVAQIGELQRTTETLGQAGRDFSAEAGRVEELVRGIQGAAQDIRNSQRELQKDLANALKEEEQQ